MSILSKKKVDDEQITTYKTKFDFSEFDINDSNLIEEIEQKEEVLKQNLIKNIKSTEQIAKGLYEINELLANHKTGTFGAYLEYVNIKKDRAYYLIDTWKLYLDTKSKKVFDLPQRMITEIKKEVKKNDDIEEAEIVEIIESDNPRENIEEIKEKRVSEVKERNKTGSLEKELQKIEKEIEKYLKKITELENKKAEIQKEM